MKQTILTILGILLAAGVAQAAIVTATSQGYSVNDLDAAPLAADLIAGLIATELPGDLGWHSANTDPLDKLPAFTDGMLVRPTGLTGLLNDFPGAGNPAKRVQYDFAGTRRIDAIHVFTGNNGGDDRIFHTYTVEFSQDGSTWSAPLYVQSHPSGTLNNSAHNQYTHVLTRLFDDAGPLAADIVGLRFDFYAVGNTGGQMRDPYDGVNPFTGVDDGLTAAFVSPLVWEIDVAGVPEPSTFALIGLGALGLLRRFRRR